MNGVEMLAKQQPILVNDLYIDPVGYQVKLGQREIELTVKEFEILYLFAQNKGKGGQTHRTSAFYFRFGYC